MNDGIKNGRYKHGLGKHPLRMIWYNMKQRCNNSKNNSYKNYGGRGIIVCNNWKELPEFYKWAIENGWEKGLDIDRIDNDGNYEPLNCQFVTHRTNNSNKRNTSKHGVGIYKVPSGKFIVRITDKNNKLQNCGTYNKIERAQEVYRISKLAIELGKS